MMDGLLTEQSIFEKHLTSWRNTNLGQYVLIKETEIIGFYPSLEKAFNMGLAKFGVEDFFVEQIRPPQTINVSFLGLVF